MTIKVNDFRKEGVGLSNRFFYEQVDVPIDGDGDFRVSLGESSRFVYIAFENLRGPEGALLWEGYLLEGDGSLHIDLSASPVSFTGGLGPLLELQVAINRHVNASRGRQSGEWDGYFDYLQGWYPAQLETIYALIGRYRERVSRGALEIVRANALNRMSLSVLGLIPHWKSLAGTGSDTAPLEAIHRIVEECLDQQVHSIAVLENSHNLADAWLSLHYAGSVLDGYDPRHDSLMTDLYGSIEVVGDRALRDRLLMAYFFNPKYKMAGLSNLDRALKLVASDDFRGKLAALNRSTSAAPPVMDFDFHDRQGAEVSSGDFSGKVVVAHFWFNGCVGCRFLAAFMESVIAHYEGREDVVFLAVNVDGDKRRWIAGTEKGAYVHHRELDLWTGLAGNRHPLLERYNYVGFPQLMVIDGEGRLVTSRGTEMMADGEGFRSGLIALVDSLF